MGVQADACLAFEDSLNGIKSSVAANLKTIITVNEYTKDDDFSGASLVLDQYGEPNLPFTVIEGDAMGYDHIDIDLLQKIHAEPRK